MQRKNNKKAKFADASRFRVGIAVSEYNPDITEKLLEGALITLEGFKVKKENIEVIRVPGSFELPLGCLMLLKQRRCEAVVALGCIVKGETEHDAYIASAVSDGLMHLSLQFGAPVGFGVLTVRNLEQARARVNKGEEAVRAVLQMALLHEEILPSFMGF